MLYIYPDGTVSDEIVVDMSDDYFTVNDASQATYRLIVRHFGDGNQSRDVYFEVYDHFSN